MMKGTAPSAAFNTTGVAKYGDFGPIEGYISETVQDGRHVRINHLYEVVYERSIGIKIGDLEWPWTA